MRKIITSIENGIETVREIEFFNYEEAKENLHNSFLNEQVKKIIFDRLKTLEYLEKLGIANLVITKNELNQVILILPSGKKITIEERDLL